MAALVPDAPHLPRNWLDSRQAQILLPCLLALPLLWPQFPPLIDLPGHMGRYAVQLDAGRDPFLAANFLYRWQLTGNLGVDLLIIPLAPLLGLEGAVKLIAILIPLLAGGGMLLVARELHRTIPPTALFALPLALGHPFTYGFLNFSLSMAVALLAFALWLRLGRASRFRLRALLFLAISTIIWLVHTYGWGFLGLLCFSAELMRLRGAGKGWLAASWWAALHCLCLTPALALMLVWRGEQTSDGIRDWFLWKKKLQWIIQIFRDRWMEVDIASVLIVVGVVGYKLVWRFKSFSGSLLLAALLLLLAFVGLPFVIFNSYFADMRLAPYVFMVALLAIGPGTAAKRKYWLWAGLAFVVAKTVIMTASFALYDARHKATLAALDHVPRNSRIVTFVMDSCPPVWFTERLEHVPDMAIVRRHAFVNSQWDVPGAQPMRIIKGDAPGYIRDPSQFVTTRDCPRKNKPYVEEALARFPRAAFDYVWLVDLPNTDPKSLAGLTLVWTNGKDSLYRINRPEMTRQN